MLSDGEETTMKPENLQFEDKVAPGSRKKRSVSFREPLLDANDDHDEQQGVRAWFQSMRATRRETGTCWMGWISCIGEAEFTAYDKEKSMTPYMRHIDSLVIKRGKKTYEKRAWSEFSAEIS